MLKKKKPTKINYFSENTTTDYNEIFNYFYNVNKRLNSVNIPNLFKSSINIVKTVFF